ncbi:MAG: HAD family hydrolase [Planctomycetales bacterium]|nr:HAD family hydrolase [Planctomycetales bacterium]MBN8624467.1 HAD family hydrolase [Planctomycetota bacterium]
MTRAVFLDRDGVLIEDVGLLTEHSAVRVLPGVAQTLGALRARGYKLVVVSNQTVIARGLATEGGVADVHRKLQADLNADAPSTVPEIDAWYFCPHHPHANVAEYRKDCECRKPKPGMLIDAASRLGIDLKQSVMIGDRLTDVAAGAAAGCRTILVQTGQHDAPPIVGGEAAAAAAKPDHVCADLAAAGRWILEER